MILLFRRDVSRAPTATVSCTVEQRTTARGNKMINYNYECPRSEATSVSNVAGDVLQIRHGQSGQTGNAIAGIVIICLHNIGNIELSKNM
jgi:hypothetical protein